MPAKTVTIKLDESLWKEAKIALIKRGTTFQEFLSSQLKRLIQENKKEREG